MQPDKHGTVSTVDDKAREELDRLRMAQQATEKVWRIAAYEGSGPVVMTMRVPEITITDSDGRFIVISPRQSAIISSRLGFINDWFQYGDDDATDPD
jgi:hypothetical protein